MYYGKLYCWIITRHASLKNNIQTTIGESSVEQFQLEVEKQAPISLLDSAIFNSFDRESQESCFSFKWSIKGFCVFSACIGSAYVLRQWYQVETASTANHRSHLWYQLFDLAFRIQVWNILENQVLGVLLPMTSRLNKQRQITVWLSIIPKISIHSKAYASVERQPIQAWKTGSLGILYPEDVQKSGPRKTT